MSEIAKCKCGRPIHENFGDQRMYYGRYTHVDENGQRDSTHYWHKAVPAVPVIEVAPGEYERCVVPAQEAPRCKWAYRAERSTDVAQSCTFSEGHEGKCSFDMAAQEAPRCYCGDMLTELGCPSCDPKSVRPAEPQAGAQVPSQDELAYAISENRRLRSTISEMGDHLNTIKSYATEAAKTPITRESIRDTRGGVDETTVDSAINFLEQSKSWAYADEIRKLVAALTAQTLTAQTQSDELQGFCRLVLSEIGGGL